jgi:hypothetical protein
MGDGPFVDLYVDELERLAGLDRFGEHEVTGDPEDADLILFTQCHVVDWRLKAIRQHPLARRYWKKVMVYDERDRPWWSFPGVYVSAPAQAFDRTSQRAWSYIRTPDVPRPSADPDLLFSFLGSDSDPCRKPLFGLSHPDGLVEEVRDFMFWDESSPGFAGKRAKYHETLMRSRFVLCPRGRGTSTFRLYETLAAGRVPVIISDDWVPPSGPDWGAFSLRWPEGRTEGLFALLEERDRDWSAMSTAACDAYASFFAADVSFHRVLDLLRDLLLSGSQPAPPARLRRRSIHAALRSKVRGGHGG